jgi:DNA processing protein
MPEEQPASPTPDERPYWLAFSHVPGIGPARFASLLARFGGAAAAWQAPNSALAEVLDRRSLAALATLRRRADPEDMARRVVAAGLTTLAWSDPAYPPLLRQVDLPPFLLYLRGDAALLTTPCVAVVGTRTPTEYGLRAARALAQGLAEAGITVVSGLALGIDAAAHEAALPHGTTIAVLGTGPDLAYPARHHGLQQRIARAGCLVSEYPPGSTPEPGNFPARNRIVSGLAGATVVVEADSRSGALITARCAADQGRDVLAVPGSIFSRQSAGTLALLADGAAVCRGADDVLGILGLAQPTPRRERTAPPDDPVAARLAAALDEGPALVDGLARSLGLPAAEVTRGLTLLELAGQARNLGGARWSAR